MYIRLEWLWNGKMHDITIGKHPYPGLNKVILKGLASYDRSGLMSRGIWMRKDGTLVDVSKMAKPDVIVLARYLMKTRPTGYKDYLIWPYVQVAMAKHGVIYADVATARPLNTRASDVDIDTYPETYGDTSDIPF